MLSTAEFGLSGLPPDRLRFTQSQVPGMICMTPRAFALETIALLKPDSCHAIAFARLAGTPCSAATWAICAELTRSLVGLGAAAGTIVVAGAGFGFVGVEAPLGSLMTVPASRKLSGSSPFIQASCCIETPAWAAMPE